jgi:hypothetical protein
MAPATFYTHPGTITGASNMRRLLLACGFAAISAGAALAQAGDAIRPLVILTLPQAAAPQAYAAA